MDNQDLSYIAHSREMDGRQTDQLLITHLKEVSNLCGQFTAKIGVREAGELIGLLHDFGKYSKQFQDYIKSATKGLNPDIDDEYVDHKQLKGKIDHSTAGAQLVWQEIKQLKNSLEQEQNNGDLAAQILAICIASHHSGLIDCLKPDGTNTFQNRIDKPDTKTNLIECQQNADKELFLNLKCLLNKSTIQALINKIKLFSRDKQHGQKISPRVKNFYLGFFTRFLFSALIDADRISSADFEHPENQSYRNVGPIDWGIPIERLERALKEFPNRNEVDEIRCEISDTCRDKASMAQGIYTLTVPTGGGKTFASLRYALYHAKKYQLDRIIFIIPFTSIIEQNAQAVRELIECDTDDKSWVLEHHSNLEPETQTWQSKLNTENWDAPIVFTTMVQFLETLFSGGTRGVRRLHQLAKSVIVFDEIQTLPIKCTHLFCNSLNFLTAYANTTAVLCTATQPLLNKLPNSDKGQLLVPPNSELGADYFQQLKRVEMINYIRPKGWHKEEIAELAIDLLDKYNSCLVIVNTKSWAKSLYEYCIEQSPEGSIFHLSTSQCPAHRKMLLNQIKERLEEKQSVLCFSTQLIEAGVDVSFASAIRFLAGLDSIAQAAGRCNRNKETESGNVYIVNPKNESIDSLPDIKEGRDQARNVLSFCDNSQILMPETMEKYFKRYFFNRATEMVYPLKEKQIEHKDSLLNLLSHNPKCLNTPTDNSRPELKQSFMTAGKAFKAIEAPTESLIVPYGEGINIINELCGIAKEFDSTRYYELLKQAQQYSVNVFPNVRKKLFDEEAIHEIQKDEGIYYLDKRHYSKKFGLSTEPVESIGFLNC